MKSFKKVILVVLLALSLAVAVGCNISFGGNDVTIDDKTKVDLQTVFNAIQNDLGDRSAIINDLNLPNSKDGVEVAWSSDRPDVIDNSGKVTRPLDDTRVLLTCVLKYGEETKRFYLEVTVKGNRAELPDGYDKINNVIAGEDGISAMIKGTVVAVTSQSFLVKDETGYLLVYLGKNWIGDLKVGNIVVVNGKTTTYAGMKQFGTDATYEIQTGADKDNATAVQLDAAKFDELLNEASVKLVSITGRLVSSGNYWNLDVDGSANKGSISYPAQNLTDFDGKNVDITGYFVGVTGSATKYITFILTDIKLNANQDIPTPPDVEESTIAEVIAAEVGATYQTSGVVVALTKQSFLLGDNGAYILVYKGSTWTSDLEVGNKVSVIGKTAAYAGLKQFGTDATYEIQTGTGSDNATAVQLDTAKFDELLNETSVKLVSVTGKLVSSGNYWNLEVEGSTNKGSISYPAQNLTDFDGKNVDITGYFVGVTGSATKYITFILTDIKLNDNQGGGTVTPPTDATEGTIAQVLAGETGKNYKTNGVVVALTAQSFLLEDNGAYILVYKGSTWTSDVQVGDKLTVTGKTTTYGGLKQFGTDAIYEAGTVGTKTTPTAEAVDAAGLDALVEATSIKLITVTGKLVKSGNYWNLEVEGATNKGSISYPAQDLANLDGKNVIVTGYFAGVTGSTTKYVTILLTDIKSTDGQGTVTPPTDVTEGTIAQVLAGETGKNYKTNGVVVALTAQSFLLEDNGAYILVYKGSTWTSDVQVGDKLTVTGKTTTYGGLKQFGTDATYERGTVGTKTTPTAIALDGAALDAFQEKTTVEYVKVIGDLEKSGNYWNLLVDGAVAKGSISYPATDLTSFDGTTVEVTGYFAGVTGSSTKYITILLTEITSYEEPLPTESVTINTILTSPTNKAYLTSGTVVAVSAQSFLIQDETGFILSYFGTDYAKDLAVGDVVSVVGKTSMYKGAVQFSKPTYTKTTETKTVTYPEVELLTTAEFDALNTEDPITHYVALQGGLIIDGNYVNIAVPSSQYYGSIAAPVEDLTALNGKCVKVEGYYVYATGSDVKYITVIATKITEVDDQTVVNLLKQDLDSSESFNIASNLTLPTEAYGATLAWASSDETAITSTGVYKAPETSTEVTFTVTITKGEATATASFKVVAIGAEKISDLLALEELTDMAHVTKGTVVAVYAQGFLMQDGNSLILVYKGADYAKDLKVGDVVIVIGGLAEYGGKRQFGTDTSYTVLEETTFTQPEARELDQAAFEALANDNADIEYVKLTAMLSISSGKYYNLKVGESTLTGSVASPAEDLSTLNGKKVTVVGYFAYVVTSGTNQYVYFVATSVTETPLTDAEYVALAEEDLLKMNGKVVKRDLTLPLESNRCTISWVSNNAAVIANDGKFTSPSADTQVKLTATITKGEETKTVEVTVTAKYIDPNAPIELTFLENDDFLAWSESYMEHTIELDDVKVFFEKADKQRAGNAIDDAPVTKGYTVIIYAKEGSFASVEWTLKQWASKEQTATISVSTDNGQTFTETTYTVDVVGTVTLGAEFTEAVNAVKLTFANQTNQVGIVSVSYKTK